MFIKSYYVNLMNNISSNTTLTSVKFKLILLTYLYSHDIQFYIFYIIVSFFLLNYKSVSILSFESFYNFFELFFLFIFELYYTDDYGIIFWWLKDTTNYFAFIWGFKLLNDNSPFLCFYFNILSIYVGKNYKQPISIAIFTPIETPATIRDTKKNFEEWLSIKDRYPRPKFTKF